MKDNTDPLDNFFNVPAIVEDEPQLPAVTQVQTELQEDFDIARTNLNEAVELAQQAYKDLSSLTKQMQSPRAYDALSKLLGSIVAANKAVVEIHKNRQDVDDVPIPQNITNNTLVMTTAEMQEYINEARNRLEENNG
jgi:hypothetical protein